MKEIQLRPHHAEMLNNVALLSSPDFLGEYVKKQMREQAPLTDEGMDYLRQLSLEYKNWGEVGVSWVDGSDDWCEKCDGLNEYNQCDHRYYFDDPNLTSEKIRMKADSDILKKYPGLKSARNLREVHRIVTRKQL